MAGSMNFQNKIKKNANENIRKMMKPKSARVIENTSNQFP